VVGGWYLVGAQTKRPESKRPAGQNVWRDKTSRDITVADITSVGQNIWWDKMSAGNTFGGTKRVADKMSVGTKHPEGKNVRRDKTFVGTKRPETKHPFGFYSILNLQSYYFTE
jgi:hypothetical protein